MGSSTSGSDLFIYWNAKVDRLCRLGALGQLSGQNVDCVIYSTNPPSSLSKNKIDDIGSTICSKLNRRNQMQHSSVTRATRLSSQVTAAENWARSSRSSVHDSKFILFSERSWTANCKHCHLVQDATFHAAIWEPDFGIKWPYCDYYY